MKKLLFLSGVPSFIPLFKRQPAFLYTLLLILLYGPLAAQTTQLFQGSFQTGNIFGGMEIELFSTPGADKSVSMRFTPQGHLDTPVISLKKTPGNRLKFIIALNGADYTFSGKRTGDRFTGKIRGLNETGHWTLRKLSSPTAGHGKLLSPSGPLPVGRIAFDWTDDQRDEPETKDKNDQRRLMVYMFFPAQQQTGIPAAYLPDATDMAGDWNPEQIEVANNIKTHSFEKATCKRDGGPFPVVIFAPGGGQKALSYTSLLEDLASHGFIVAAIDPPYNAQAVRFSDGTVLKKLPPEQRGWDLPKTRDDMPRIYEQMVIHWSKDMSFVLNRLTELNHSDSLFSGRLDLSHVGAIGHSRGGQAAGKVRLLDARFNAGINLDGNIRGRGFPPDSKGKGGQQPFLWIEKQFPWPKKDLEGLTLQQFDNMWKSGDSIMRTIASESYRIMIARPEIDHLDFGDLPMLNKNITDKTLAGKERTLRFTRTAVLMFFSRHLKGNRQNIISDLHLDFPEVNIKRFANTAIHKN